MEGKPCSPPIRKIMKKLPAVKNVGSKFDDWELLECCEMTKETRVLPSEGEEEEREEQVDEEEEE